jgi:hypothetical protein
VILQSWFDGTTTSTAARDTHCVKSINHPRSYHIINLDLEVTQLYRHRHRHRHSIPHYHSIHILNHISHISHWSCRKFIAVRIRETSAMTGTLRPREKARSAFRPRKRFSNSKSYGPCPATKSVLIVQALDQPGPLSRMVRK